MGSHRSLALNYYARKDTQGKITTVEAYSHNAPVPGAEPITQTEYDDFIASLPVPVLGKTILTKLIEALEAKGIISPSDLA